jgi:release factor glutamine methyltransferase
LLLSYCLKKNRVQLYIDFESNVSDEELSAFRELVRRRARREPVSYILGSREFWSINFTVKRDVLIPRPETEVLVEQAAKILLENAMDKKQIEVLEIGTGSGVIPVSLAKDHKNIVVFSVDISFKALKVAKVNVQSNGFDNRIMLVCGDSLRPFKNGKKFDMIVSNPPYVSSLEFDMLDPEIKNYEPKLALDGGKDGLYFYSEWIPELPFMLNTDGWFVFELGDKQADAVTGMFTSSNSFTKIKIVKDYAGRDRVILGKRR